MTSLLTADRGQVMARVVILGAGISGHTAALHLRRLLGKGHEVVVVSPNADWNWIPSNIWVGVGRMPPEAAGQGGRDLARGGRRQRAAGRGYRLHPPRSRGRAGAAGLRLPDQRHRAEAELRPPPGP